MICNPRYERHLFGYSSPPCSFSFSFTSTPLCVFQYEWKTSRTKIERRAASASSAHSPSVADGGEDKDIMEQPEDGGLLRDLRCSVGYSDLGLN